MFQAWNGNLFQYSSLKATHWKNMVRRLGLNPAVQIKEHFLSIKFKTNGCQSTEVGVKQKQNTRSDYRPTATADGTRGARTHPSTLLLLCPPSFRYMEKSITPTCRCFKKKAKNK